MALIDCAECGNKVSTTAATCPHCGAPFKKFMGKPKGFKDRFSVERVDAAQAEAKAELGKAKGGCLSTMFGLLGLILLLLIVAALIT